MVDAYGPATLPDAPQADADLDVRSLRAFLAVDEDGDPVLVLRDDHTTVVVEFGLGGAWETAIQSALGLSKAALRYGEALHELRAKRRAEPAANRASGDTRTNEDPCA